MDFCRRKFNGKARIFQMKTCAAEVERSLRMKDTETDFRPHTIKFFISIFKEDKQHENFTGLH